MEADGWTWNKEHTILADPNDPELNVMIDPLTVDLVLSPKLVKEVTRPQPKKRRQLRRGTLGPMKV
jgi:hypothetical protein